MSHVSGVPAGEVVVVTVFAASDDGGNPAPIVVDARAMSDAAMQQVAASTGHESGFVVDVPAGVEADIALRFWVPNHEMSMCGHATIAAVWLLHGLQRIERDHVTVHTASGQVEARIEASDRVSISQPVGRGEPVDPPGVDAALRALQIAGDVAAPARNAVTSRVKTLLPLPDVEALDAIRPDVDAVASVCEQIGSTGLYPFAPVDRTRQLFAARQFPRSSGYPEDPATGIAASALAFALLEAGDVDPHRPVRIRQGWAMGRPSEITVDFRFDGGGEVVGCWVGGPVRLA